MQAFCAWLDKQLDLVRTDDLRWLQRQADPGLKVSVPRHHPHRRNVLNRQVNPSASSPNSAGEITRK